MSTSEWNELFVVLIQFCKYCYVSLGYGCPEIKLKENFDISDFAANGKQPHICSFVCWHCSSLVYFHNEQMWCSRVPSSDTFLSFERLQLDLSSQCCIWAMQAAGANTKIVFQQRMKDANVRRWMMGLIRLLFCFSWRHRTVCALCAFPASSWNAKEYY